MLVDFPDFVYNANPQSVYAKRIQNPFLQVREVGRAAYDLSSNAGNFVAPIRGQSFSLSEIDSDAIVLFKIIGDDDYPVVSLLSVLAGDVKAHSNVGDGSVAASSSNSAPVLQFLPPTIDQTPTADIASITYFFSAGSPTGNLVVARSVIHADRVTIVGYEAH